VMSKWKFRPPPRGVSRDQLILCPVTGAGNTCSLGDHCDEAHSAEELQEWKFRWGETHRSSEKSLTYSETILNELLDKASLGMLTDKLPGVIFDSNQKDVVQFSERNSSTIWLFKVISNKLLKGVSLQDVESLDNFSISDVTLISMKDDKEISVDVDSSANECVIDQKEDDSSDNTETKKTFNYSLKIKFHTNIFGKFKQTVVFDFGTRPLLSKTLIADVVPISADSELQSIKESILKTSDPWDVSSSDIILFDPAPAKVHKDEDNLLSSYPSPFPSTFKMAPCVTEANLTKENYKERLHQLLFIEEMSQFQALESFNAIVNVQLTVNYLVSATPSNASTAKYARPGELFGRIELGAELSEDSPAGRLILTRCNSILLKFNTFTLRESKKKKKENKVKFNKKKRIWECLIEDTLKTVLYIRLSSKMVEENNLTPDVKLKAEVQFKLSRLSLTEMHQAIDKISSMSHLHPDIDSVPSIPWYPATEWPNNNLNTKLNPKQREAIRAITSSLDLILPPILIIGPYGTGKTFTLGKAIEELLMVEDNRILVCTHSNSAADLYIKDYLDPSIQSGKISNKKLIRVYYHNRWVQTVQESVLKYCLIETDPLTASRSFRYPTSEDLIDADIVVATLSTSRTISELLPRGYFTHILLDEAAQALEAETIMPLVLAEKKTRVVLAGDHMQLEPGVTSHFAKEKKLGVSLLERLYYLYPEDYPCKILLCENYRSAEAIVDYTSDMFYQQKLVASGKQPCHPVWHPLTFFTARGEDYQDTASTSFYNNSEVAEIVDRMAELKRNWPKIWGYKDECEIGVVTPYHDQVTRIRTELRKKKLYNISVERVQNVQGKQYRAIFISVVRTRRTCNKTDSNQMTTLDYGFLSSAKLLNTAITRAQSLVAVIGDPVALVSVGRCRKLWQCFLQICEEKNSLFGFSMDQLRSHLEAIELKKIYGLNPLAEEFIPQERWRKMDKKSQKEVKFWTPGSVPPVFPSSPSLTTSIASTTSSNTPTMPDSHPVPHPPIIPPQLLLSYYNWLASGIASPPPPPFYNPAFANMVNRMPGMPPIPPMPPMPHYLHTQIPPRPPGGFSGTSPAFFTGQSNPGLLRPPLSPHRAPPVPNLMDLPMGLPPWSQGGHLPPVPVPPNLASNSMFPPLPPALSSNTMFPPLPAASSAMASSSSSAAGKAPSSQEAKEPDFLPASVSLTQMQREPILAEAWYHHLLKSGLDAEKFREMLSRGNSNSAQQNPDFPVKARTPDSGCINSPPATDQHERTENINDNIRTDNADDDEEDDTLNMEDVFKSIIGDLDPDTGDNVPLYMRGAGPSPQDITSGESEINRGHGNVSRSEATTTDRFSSLAIDDAAGVINHQQQFRPGMMNLVGQPLFPLTSQDGAASSPLPTYANVLRQERKPEVDTLTLIRSLGTKGSQV